MGSTPFPLRQSPLKLAVVGKVAGEGWILPLILAFAHPDAGIVADAVMMSEYEVRPLFGFSRSYFHADLPAVEPAVQKLHRSYAEFTRLVGSLSEAEFASGEVDTPQLGRVPRWRIAMLGAEHHINHKAELFMYLKFLGIEVHTGTLYRG